VIVELDSWKFHRTRHAFERDREKITRLQLAGYVPLPFTWRRMAIEPEALVGDVRTALASAA
jgi:hypothetical protein